MQNDGSKFVQKCHKWQIHGDLIKDPPAEQNAMTSPWSFAAWGMDVIGPIEPTASNKYRFILVAIDYFTKWVEAASYSSVTKKVVTDFVRNNIICRFGIPESIIIDNGANLNSHLMKDICLLHSYHWIPHYFGTSTRATPYLLVYGLKAIIPAEVEIPSLRIIQEAELDDAEWIRKRYEQLALINEKMMIAFCHGRRYQQRMARAFKKHVRTRVFQIGQLVLKRIFPNQEEYKGKFAPNWQEPYMVQKVLSGEAVVLAKMDGQEWPKAINSDAFKRYYV
ncbi:uncharacterized protein LOC132054287 [Lycium ferocissimum]|uniref:uncharacterized protein LOC132054287 n=1 Tax=Lycium ferocissimum TaxID=112874 RepID=UPI002815CCC1|nr:uncharacterized protein LOC132054287 [Lycium ferocissimum]